MKRFVITKEVLDLIHDADTDLNDIRRLIWSLPPIPEWATHFAHCNQKLVSKGNNFGIERFEEIPK